jgi:hypothetical protein
MSKKAGLTPFFHVGTFIGWGQAFSHCPGPIGDGKGGGEEDFVVKRKE